MSEGKVMVRVIQLQPGATTHEVFRGLIDAVPRTGEKVVTSDKVFVVTEVTHGLWRAHGESCQEVTVSVVEVRA